MINVQTSTGKSGHKREATRRGAKNQQNEQSQEDQRERDERIDGEAMDRGEKLGRKPKEKEEKKQRTRVRRNEEGGARRQGECEQLSEPSK